MNWRGERICEALQRLHRRVRSATDLEGFQANAADADGHPAVERTDVHAFAVRSAREVTRSVAKRNERFVAELDHGAIRRTGTVAGLRVGLGVVKGAR